MGSRGGRPKTTPQGFPDDVFGDGSDVKTMATAFAGIDAA
jgi:hypothetical protein